MRILIVEDDETSRRLLQQFLTPYGTCDSVRNGKEAVTAFEEASGEGKPYALVCLDIMMPEMDGHSVLKKIRSFEATSGVANADVARVVMTSALDDSQNVLGAFKEGCEGYVVKPIKKDELIHQLEKLGLIENQSS